MTAIKRNLVRGFIALVLVFLALLAFTPFLYMCVISLTQKSTLDLNFAGVDFNFNNYVRVFKNLNTARNFLNSVIVTCGACILNCVICSMVAYGFSKKRWPGRDKVFGLYLATLMVPGQVTLIPVFLIIKQLGLMNTHLALMLPIVNAFGVFLMRQFIMNVPDDLLEATRIDGCSENRLFCEL